jgi:cytochrome c556
MRAATDKAVASPPLTCEGVGVAMKDIGEACKACHQDFR